jgi:hypothetical protein
MSARKLGLSDDARERAPFQRIVKGNGYRDCCLFYPFLHDPVAATLANRDESVPFENPTNLVTRKDAKPTQPGPLPA